nr:MAG TPA: hypothetical protein [Caudoviricetes sp.]
MRCSSLVEQLLHTRNFHFQKFSALAVDLRF